MRKTIGLLFAGILLILPASAQEKTENTNIDVCTQILNAASMTAEKSVLIDNECVYQNAFFGTGYKRWVFDRVFVHPAVDMAHQLPNALPTNGQIRIYNAAPLPYFDNKEGQRIVAFNIKMNHVKTDFSLSWHYNSAEKRLIVSGGGGNKNSDIMFDATLKSHQGEIQSFPISAMAIDGFAKMFAVEKINIAINDMRVIRPVIGAFIAAQPDDPEEILETIRLQVKEAILKAPEKQLDRQSRVSLERFIDDFPFNSERFYLNAIFSEPLTREKAMSILLEQKVPDTLYLFSGYGRLK